jgi:membrane protein YqaA with SNARE-associated domain
MGRFVRRVHALAIAFGAPGLFLIAFLDSSFLSLPEISDLLVISMVTHHKARLLLYVIAATTGSIAGCLVMYYIGKKGGEAVVRKRFASANVERTMASVRRHGMMAVLIPSILPPPMPFKIFVILAGVAGISVAKFVTAIAVGRGMRYLALGILAVKYGDQAMAYMREHATTVSLAAVALLALVFLAYQLWNRAQAAQNR